MLGTGDWRPRSGVHGSAGGPETRRRRCEILLRPEDGNTRRQAHGFPSNDFGGQEPGTAEEIATFCKNTYDVTFPLFSKVQTKPGEKQSAVYAHLGKASGNLPAWNFSKYVVDKEGNVVAFFPSKTTPDSPELKAALEKALAAK